MKLSQEDMEEAWNHVIENNLHLMNPSENFWAMIYVKDNGDISEIDVDLKNSPFTTWVSGNQDLYAREGMHNEDEKQGITVPKDTEYYGYNE